MQFFIAARIDNHVELEKGIRDVDFSDAGVLAAYKSAFSNNYNQPTNNICLYYEEEPLSESATLILDGASYELTWTGDAITNLDLSLEYAKKWISVSADKTDILADGVEEIILKAQVLLADKSGVDTSFNENIDILVGKGKSRFNFYQGIASKSFKSTESGTILFPSITKRLGNYRINNNISFDIIN